MMVTIKGKYWYIVLFLFLSWGTFFAQAPTYLHFEPGIDIPFSTTYGDIIQDSLGYIWFGTDSGLYRYDGEDFEKIPFRAQILDNEAFDLKQGKHGTLWFLSLTGNLCYLHENQDSVRVFNPNNFLAHESIFRFKIQQGHILFQTKNKLKKNDYKLYSFDSYSDMQIKKKYTAKGPFQFGYTKENELIYTKNYRPLGIMDFEIVDSAHIIQKFALNFPSTNHLKVQFFYDQDGIFLILNSSKDGTAYTTNNHRITPIKLFANHQAINNWYVKDKKHWFLTDNGCYEYNLKTNKTKIFRLEGHNIHSMLIDREGGLWYGTSGNGVFYFPPKMILDYKDHNLLHDDIIQKIQKIQNGPYTIASKNKIIFLDPKSLSPLSNKITLPNSISDIYIDHNKIFAATGHQTYEFIFNPKSQQAYLKQSYPISGKKIIPMNNGSFYLGGASYFKYYSLSLGKQPILTERVTALFKDTISNKLWVGGLQKASFINYNSKDITSVSRLKGINTFVTHIARDLNGFTWLATTSSGLIRVNQTHDIKKYPFYINQKHKKIDLISCNNPSKIWLSNYNNIYCFNTKTAQYLKQPDIKNIIQTPITTLWDSNDTLLIGTKKGLFVYFSNLPPPNTIPLIDLEEVKINYRDTTIQPEYNLSYSQNNIGIKFNTIGAYNPLNKALVYYRFSTSDTWHLAPTKQVTLTKLSPGQYEITAKSVTSENQKEFNTTTIRFAIKKPFWQTIWFTILVALVFLALAFGWFYNKKKQIILQKNRERESEKLKNAVLQLQMNPHFIFNSMNTIIYYITVSNKQKSIQMLTKMSRLIRKIFNFSNKDLILLPTELSFLTDYLDMEQERFSEKVKIITSISPAAFESSLMIPPLMVQPILENSFKHGLFHKQGDGILRFTVELVLDQVIFTIEDNGVGRKKTKQVNKKISSYDVIGNRIKLINENEGEFANILANFVIEDLFDLNNNPTGTRSILTFEIKKV